MTKREERLNILFIRLSALGDVVHALPAAARVKNLYPHARISWVVEQASAPLLFDNPCVDEVIVFPKQALKEGIGLSLKTWRRMPDAMAQLRAFLAEIDKTRFDLAIDFQGLLKSALILTAVKSRVKAGFAQAREMAPFLYTHRYRGSDYFSFDKHVVDHNLALVDFALGCIGLNTSVETAATTVFPLPCPETLQVDEAPDMGEVGSKGRIKIGLIPGTTWQSKIWPAKRWGELAFGLQNLSARLEEKSGSSELRDVRIVILGGAGEKSTNARIVEIARKLSPEPGSEIDLEDLTGKTDLRELITILRSLDIVIGADTGPMHLAVAAGVPIVLAVHGSTPWGRNGPYGPSGVVVSKKLQCQPCFEKVCPLSTLECLESLESEEVLSELVSAIYQRRRKSDS